MSTITKYASLVKFSHTIFAMPFALIGYVYALTSTDAQFSVKVLVLMLLCMVFARNAAMGFNRWADRVIDAQNPRTKGREIPAGKVSARNAFLFVVVNAVAFIVAAGFINRLCLWLSPVALFVILGYSFTKRFTSLAHIVLGVSLAIAPVGAYIAVTGTIDSFVPLLISALVLTWTAGFDILYSLQDEAYDKSHGLHSIPSRVGTKRAVAISILLHVITAYNVFIVGMLMPVTSIYWIGAWAFIGLLTFQHIYFTPRKIERVGAAFGLINGLSSIVYAAFTIADMLIVAL